jgi:hypothetical protein
MLQPVSVIVPETVTGIIFPFGGHKDAALVETVITGGVVQNGVLFSSTPSEPNPPIVPSSISQLNRPLHDDRADPDKGMVWIFALHGRECTTIAEAKRKRPGASPAMEQSSTRN